MMRLAFVVALILPGILTHAQNARDSLRKLTNTVLPDTTRVKVLDDLGYEYLMINQDSALMYGQQAVDLARKIKYQKGLGQSLSDLGVALFYKAELTQAIQAWEESLTIRTALKDEAGVASLAVKLGAAYFKQGNFIKSMESQATALNAFEKLNNIAGQTSALNNIAAVFEHQKEYGQALTYHRKSLRLAQAAGNKEAIGNSLINIGNIYYTNTKLDSAKWYWLESLHYLTEEKSPQYLAISYNNLADLYTQEGNVKEALLMNEKSIALRKKINDLQGYISSLNIRGNLLMKNGELSSAEKYLKASLDSATKYELLIEQQKILGNLSALYEQSNRYKDALAYYKKYTVTKDTLLNENTRKNTNDLLIKYETEKKEARLAIQNIELAQQKSALKQTYFILIALLIVVVLLVIIYLLAKGRYERKLQLSEKEKELAVREAFIDATLQSQEEERKRVAKDLHDSMGQLISALHFTLAKLTPASTPEERLNIVEQSEQVLDDMHNEVRSVAFNLMPQILIQSGLVPALHEMALRIHTRHTLRIEITSFEMPERLSELQEISIYRIIQEWINNIIKYAHATKIELNLVGSEKEISITVEDNGAGFDSKLLENGNGIGWRNMQSRTNLIKGTLHIDTVSGRTGTTLLLNTPILLDTNKSVEKNTLKHG